MKLESYRPTMDPEVLHSWAKDAQKLINKLQIERYEAQRDRDKWKASATQYHKTNTSLDENRSKLIRALRSLDPANPILPENILT